MLLQKSTSNWLLFFICTLIIHFNWVAFYLVLTCVLRFTAGISLLDDVSWILTRLITIGDVVLRLYGSGLCDLKPDRCVVLYQIDSYLNLMEDPNYFSILQFLLNYCYFSLPNFKSRFITAASIMVVHRKSMCGSPVARVLKNTREISWFGLSRPYVQQWGVLRIQKHPSQGVTMKENESLTGDCSVLSYGSSAVVFLRSE